MKYVTRDPFGKIVGVYATPQEGGVLVADDDPDLQDYLGEDLSGRRRRAADLVNRRAESVRMRWITPGAGQMATYLAKEQEAVAFQAAVSGGAQPDAGDYPLLAAEVGITAEDLGGVAATVRDRASQWRVAAAAIEAARKRALAAIEAAASQEEIDGVVAAIVWPAP